ncbi:FMN-linked oxidoreductase [Aspergillus carlsbadensis]|nr:FMN-linked oxidoreductase [Aspergillus carlsbadensis]
MSETRLFKPLKIGNIQVQHRIGMAPLTRQRATADRVPTAMMKEYYSQRASVPGTLIITEGAIVSYAAGGGFPHGPGIWTDEQIAAWKTITDEVHRKGCFIFIQLFAFGRAAVTEVAEAEGVEIVAPSAIPIPHEEIPGAPTPRAMTVDEIKQTVIDFTAASKNAIAAGFDGVEVHGANGYLLDQFLQDTSNQRDDEYGGSVENRSRILREVLHSVVGTIGPDRVGLRLSPWSRFQGMRMEDPIPQFVDVVDQASRLNLAYLHLVESRIETDDVARNETEQLDFVYERWNGPILVAGGYTPTEARWLVDEEHPEKDIMVIFGRHFISNPDLVYKIQNGLELRKYDRATFYACGSPVGYVDYPFSPEYLAVEGA